ncbi:hypothetical protein E8E12_007288 [Didymella heteroderae]|uniref:Uncharacterized protein n=1 Tax=Didymella heteroderae TaxID=1769908 RepID=A0A9P5C6Y5_9PLEO|nr:hypothetical protein E8E12_007288 [Didymella heteroderae]
MRKKVTLGAMADGDVFNSPDVSRPSASLKPQKNEFARSVKRLGHTARGTAQRLHAIAYLRRSPSVVTELITEVYALAAILSGLEDDLLLESVSETTDQRPIWTSEHHKNLVRSIEECDDVLRTVSRAVRIADEEFRVLASSKKANDYVEHFKLDDGPQALETIVRCFHLVSKTRVMVRHTALSRIESLNDEEIQELLRLSQALQHPDLDAVWARKEEPFVSKQMQRFPITLRTSLTTPTKLLEEEEAAASTAPDQSLRPNTKLVLTPDCVLTVPPGKTKPGEVTFGKPSVIKPIPSSSSFADLQSGSPFAKYKHPVASLSGPRPPHLEAYMLRPTVQSTQSTSTLSYGDVPLQLSEEAIQAQLRSLGPDYSVMDELLNLHPQQLQLVLQRAALRHGEIVSIQHGRPMNLDTIMGCMQVKPAIYIISPTTALPLEGFGSSQTSLFTNDARFPATSGTAIVGKGLFDGAENDNPAPRPASTWLFPNLRPGTSNTAPAPSLAASPAGPGLFQSSRGPLMTVYNDFPGGAGSRGYYSSPEAYSRHLEEKGEVCTHVEPTECKGEFQHYQTITANKELHGPDKSLEEIRLADYWAGRRYDGTGKSLFAGFGGSSARPNPLFTPAGTSEAKWYPKPPNGDDVTFPPYRGRYGPTFAGFAVDNSMKEPSFTKISESSGFKNFAGSAVNNSGKAPLFTKSWPATSASGSGSDPVFRLPSSYGKPFGGLGTSMRPFEPPKAPEQDISRPGPSATTPSIPTGNASGDHGAQKEVTQPLFHGLGGGQHARFGPAVGAADPSDQSKWITHSQSFCKFKHQHGKLCRVSPEEAETIRRGPSSFAKPAVSSGFSKFADASSENPFAALKNKPLFGSLGAAPASGVDKTPFEQAVKGSSPTSPDTRQSPKDGHSGSIAQTTGQKPCVSFGCEICRPVIPQSDSSAKITTTRSMSGGLFGGSASRSNDSLFASNRNTPVSSPGLFGRAPLFGGVPTETKPQPVASTSNGGFFGRSALDPGRTHSSCLPSWSTSGQASIPTASSPFVDNPYRGDQTQNGCALFAQQSKPPPPPGGLFGNTGKNESALTSCNSDRPARTAQSSQALSQPLCGPSGISNTPASATSSTVSGQTAQTTSPSTVKSLFDTLDTTASKISLGNVGQPVQATVVAPGTRWSGSGFNASVVGTSSTLEGHQRQSAELEERKKEAMHAKTAAMRGPHDDAALAALISSAKPAPIDDVISALLSDDKSENEKEGWYRAGLATVSGLEDSTTVAKEEDASSPKGKKSEDAPNSL